MAKEANYHTHTHTAVDGDDEAGPEPGTKDSCLANVSLDVFSSPEIK